MRPGGDGEGCLRADAKVARRRAVLSDATRIVAPLKRYFLGIQEADADPFGVW